jgi:hypothetical protein
LLLFIFEKGGKKKVNYREMEVETVKRRECLPRITTKAGRNGPTKRIGKQTNKQQQQQQQQQQRGKKPKITHA